jgi:hypothetical protein
MKKTKPEVAATATKAKGRPQKAARKGQRAARAAKAGQEPRKARTATTAKKGPARKGRTDTKQAKLIAMLQNRAGATIEELTTTFGWQPHTVRGAIAGALKKKLRLNVTSEKVEGRGRVYRIAD